MTVKQLEEKGWVFSEHEAFIPAYGAFIVVAFEKGDKLKTVERKVSMVQAQLDVVTKALTIYQTLKENLS